MPSPLQDEVSRYGVRLTDEQDAQFDRYLALLQQWSSRANLVGDASAETVRSRHFAESIALGAALREREILRPGARVIDVGAGAGFPGLPIAIVWPQVRLTLIDATRKKTDFLEAVVRELRVDADVRTGRAEDLAHEADLREAFDLALARAVAPLPTLLELTLPFVRAGGRLVTVKGSKADDEVVMSRHALDVLHARAFVVPFNVPGPPQRIVAVVKDAPTPAEYPRRPGVPAKSPL